MVDEAVLALEYGASCDAIAPVCHAHTTSLRTLKAQSTTLLFTPSSSPRVTCPKNENGSCSLDSLHQDPTRFKKRSIWSQLILSIRRRASLLFEPWFLKRVVAHNGARGTQGLGTITKVPSTYLKVNFKRKKKVGMRSHLLENKVKDYFPPICFWDMSHTSYWCRSIYSWMAALNVAWVVDHITSAPGPW